MPNLGHADILREIAAHTSDEFKQDVVSFRVTIPTSGDITQPANEQLRSNYDYYVRRVRASMTGAGNTANAATADTQYDDIQEIRFNFRESGSGQNMFTSDIELATLCDSNTGRPSGDLEFTPHGYKLRAGSHIIPTFTRRASAVTTARIVVVQLICELIPRNYHQLPPRQY